MRGTIIFAALALTASPALAHSAKKLAAVTHEPDTYRFGTPFQSYSDTSPTRCAELCAEETSCKVWVHVPASYERGARCDLKDLIGAVERRPGTMSGVSTALLPAAAVEPDLAGGPDPLPEQPAPILQTPKAPLPEPEPEAPAAEEITDPHFTIDPVDAPAPSSKTPERLIGTPIKLTYQAN